MLTPGRAVVLAVAELGNPDVRQQSGDRVRVKHALGCEPDRAGIAANEPRALEGIELSRKVVERIGAEEVLVGRAIDREASEAAREMEQL